MQILVKISNIKFHENPTGCVRGSNPGTARFSARTDRPWGPPSLLYHGCRVFPGGKVRPGRDGDHSPPSSAVVSEQYTYTSTHPLGHNQVCKGNTLPLPTGGGRDVPCCQTGQTDKKKYSSRFSQLLCEPVLKYFVSFPITALSFPSLSYRRNQHVSFSTSHTVRCLGCN